MFAVLGDVELVYWLAVQLPSNAHQHKPKAGITNTRTHVDGTRKRVVEPLDKLDGRTLSASRGTNERDVCTRLDRNVQVAQDTHTRTRGVAEVDVLEPDATSDVLWYSALSRLRVNLRLGVEERNSVRGSAGGGRHVWDELEDVASLNGSKGRALQRAC